MAASGSQGGISNFLPPVAEEKFGNPPICWFLVKQEIDWNASVQEMSAVLETVVADVSFSDFASYHFPGFHGLIMVVDYRSCVPHSSVTLVRREGLQNYT